MKFRMIDDTKELELGGSYIVAFESSRFDTGNGVLRLCPDTLNTYMYVNFKDILAYDPTVLVEDDDLDYVGFSKAGSIYRDGELKVIWKKITNVAAYSKIPIIMWDEYIEKDE